MQKRNNKKILKYLIFAIVFKKFIGLLKNKKTKNNLYDFLKQEEAQIAKIIKKQKRSHTFGGYTKKIFKDFFIPHQNNNHKPKILRTKSLAIIIALLLMLKIIAISYIFLMQSEIARMAELAPSQILNLINKERDKNNLKPLTSNPFLEKAALAKAQDMINKNYFAHQSPDGKMPWDFINRSEYAYLYAGENLAMNFTQAQSVHQALMKSPPHKKNILNEHYENIGIAILSGTIDGENTNILVEMFASPIKTKLVTTQLSPKSKAQEVQTSTSTNITNMISQNTEKILALEKEPDEQDNNKRNIIKTKNTTPVPHIQKAGTTKTKLEKSSSTKFWSSSTPKIAKKNKILTKAEMHGKTIKTYPLIKQKIKITPLNNELKLIKTPKNTQELWVTRFNQAVKIIFFMFLIILLVALILNIFIEFSIQHHSVIIQAIMAIMLVIGLAQLKIGLVETIACQYIAIL